MGVREGLRVEREVSREGRCELEREGNSKEAGLD